MTYAHQNLLSWLKSHTCINISELQRQAAIPDKSLDHFIKERRDIAEINFKKVEEILVDYGYVPLDSE